jgi:hypothetical protein
MRLNTPKLTLNRSLSHSEMSSGMSSSVRSRSATDPIAARMMSCSGPWGSSLSIASVNASSNRSPTVSAKSNRSKSIVWGSQKIRHCGLVSSMSSAVCRVEVLDQRAGDQAQLVLDERSQVDGDHRGRVTGEERHAGQVDGPGGQVDHAAAER